MPWLLERFSLTVTFRISHTNDKCQAHLWALSESRLTSANARPGKSVRMSTVVARKNDRGNRGSALKKYKLYKIIRFVFLITTVFGRFRGEGREKGEVTVTIWFFIMNIIIIFFFWLTPSSSQNVTFIIFFFHTFNTSPPRTLSSPEYPLPIRWIPSSKKKKNITIIVHRRVIMRFWSSSPRSSHGRRLEMKKKIFYTCTATDMLLFICYDLPNVIIVILPIIIIVVIIPARTG